MISKEDKTLKHYIIFFIMTVGVMNSSIHSAVTMDMTVTRYEKTNPLVQQVVLYFEKNHIKASDEQGFSMLYNLEENNVISIDHDSRIYKVIDKNTIHELRKRQALMKTRMQETISKASQEKRAVMEESMRKQMAEWNVPAQLPMAGVSRVQKTTRVERAGGYDCSVYDYYYNNEKIKEYCMISWADLNVNENVRDNVNAISGFSSEILSKLKYMPTAQEGLNYFSYVTELEGFPLIVREFSGNNIVKESIVDNISKQVFESELFAPLHEYKKMEINI